MGMFADGPGTGSNAAMAYLNSRPWSGMSDTSLPMTPGLQQTAFLEVPSFGFGAAPAQALSLDRRSLPTGYGLETPFGVIGGNALTIRKCKKCGHR